MKKIIVINVFLAAPNPRIISDIVWNDYAGPSKMGSSPNAPEALMRKETMHPPIPAGAKVVTNSGGVCLRFEHTEEKPVTLPLLTVTNPPISNTLYAVKGEIQYENVEGDGYLEMWNVFPSGQYFSRTLDAVGPLGKITGTSGWRRFVLPFDRTGTTELPTCLEINAFLPGRGTIYIGPVTFTDRPEAGSVADVMFPGGWWSMLTGVEITAGGIGLALVLGLALALLGRGGKARGLVLPMTVALSVIGIGAALAGAASLAVGQPGYVWGVLGFLGLVLLAVFPLLFNRLRKRYAEFELRRMTSLDAQRA